MVERKVRSRLKEIRTDRGFTIEGLANEAGVSPNSVGMLDRDVARRVDLKTIGRLCSALDVEPGDIFTLY